jgi:D-glycero-D-manno-heptose 1,7-bisphosphate phosphatase
MYPAIFLDRDGVIVDNRDSYILNWSDMSIFRDAVDAIAKVSNSGFKLVIITNQSAIGRGLLKLEVAISINERLEKVIVRSGGRIDGIYMCPHSPSDHCNCRKPLPGLILQAANDLSLDLSRSMIIGDAWSDLLAGQAAGIPTRVLVRTGRGKLQSRMPVPPELNSYLLYETLADALFDLVLKQ